ncbi:MAG: DnaJ domain-containing protein [Dehalococcoidia bacterium]
MSSKFKDYYEVLGVAPRSHVRVIEATYWERAHELQRQPTRRSAKRLNALNEAYETLGTPYRRESYDQAWARNAQGIAEPERRAGFMQLFVNVLGKAFRPD